MATGVSVTAPVIFTFSEAMNTAATSASFLDTSSYQSLPVLPVWGSGDTVLTYTPVSSWPVNHMVLWIVHGQAAGGMPLAGTPSGFFTAGSSDSGCDTNATLLSVTVARGWMYEQTTASEPALNTNSPYCFLACTTIPCPRSATNVTLQFPSTDVRNLTGTTIPGHLTLPDCSYTDQAAFEAAFTNGNYVFTFQSASSNPQITVNCPPSLTQPPAPHLTNLIAGQAINPSQPFTLGWDPLAGGTAADCIYVEIYGGVFNTPALGIPGALNGTATSVVLPAGTFQPNRSYQGVVTFYHYALLTNGSSHVSLIYRASSTEFALHTTSGLVITNYGRSAGNNFSFEVTCAAGQALVAEYKANPGPGTWQTLATTNTTTTCVRFTHPDGMTNRTLVYRVRTGP